jgi:hypothetical protein
MKKDEAWAYCPRCRHKQLFIKEQIDHRLHLILAILTGGLWAVSWAAVCVGKTIWPWRCEHCGWHNPDFDHKPEPLPSFPDARNRPD